jgi:hypothetical protein
MTVANAGHLAPYRNGLEMPVVNGLPLGLTAESAYAEASFRLGESETLTLMTDGVVEARKQVGQSLRLRGYCGSQFLGSEWFVPDSEVICSDRSRCAGRFFGTRTWSAAAEAGNGDD